MRGASPFARAAPEPAQPEAGAPPMSTVAALCIIAFLVVMAVLNKVEFGRFD